MAELVLSALLPVLIEKLTSAALKSVARDKGIEAEIKKWQRSLKQIQRVLAHASRHEIANDAVKEWLNDLQHLVYDIDDVLDGWATEVMNTHEQEATSSKVRKLIPTCCTNFSRGTSTTMLGINSNLEYLVKQKDYLDLKVKGETRPKNKNRRLQTSMVRASSIVGRQAEKEAVVQQLLLSGDEPCDQNISVVPIFGMGGVGKTTLARLLYDEQQVKDHFEVKAWVCVSDEFDSFAISKVIFQSVTGENKGFADLNLLQEDLRNHLRDKRFLLVLDDVWSESYEDWETLVGPFYACASGSKIIITTRKDRLLKRLGCDNLNQLQGLQHDDALSVVAQHALGVKNFDSHLSLKPHGEGIVGKCKGLPLALIVVGRLLRTRKNEEEYWKQVLHSEIWMSQDGDGILPALKLSYYDLPAHLKRLFEYCSLFPKGFMFDKSELVVLWMAEGFLNPTTANNEMESLGQEYFDDLLSRLFFQPVPDYESFFVMHDLMNDLATSVAGELFLRFDNETEKSIREKMLEKYRHVSFVREEYVTYKKFESLKRAKCSRTFLALERSRHHSYLSDKILVDLLSSLPLLRVLSLSNFHITEVPELIGTLRHLRYLNVSQTRITYLPESVGNLYNLQTLIVFGCNRLTKLPKSFFKLKNLRHFDTRDTQLLTQMPLEIHELKSLQTLSKIIIGGENGFEIAKLKELKNLRGKISIVGLDKVQNAIHAKEANISQKRFSELEVEWSDVLDGSQNEMLGKEVLNELKPCNDYLKQLKIGSYGGLEFPVWVGDPSFHQLKLVSIRGCKKCTSLPPLGQLPSLKELFLEDLKVTVVDMDLLGTALECPSLEILSFVDMPGWRKWSTNSGVVFPSLQQLHIRNCPNLVEVLLEALPSLNVLETVRCDNGVLKKLVQIASAVTKLDIRDISGLNDVVWRGVIEYLGAVEELSITDCNKIQYLWESEEVASKYFVKLRKLKVDNCDNMLSLGEKEEDNCRGNFLSSLTMLDVCHCKNMERCNCPVSIDTLSVYNCISMTVISLLTEGQKLKSLFISGCKKLLEEEWGGHKLMNNTRSIPMFDFIDIRDWSNLKSITELNFLDNLTSLKLINCRSLESFPDNELSSLTLLKYLHITDCPSMNVCFPRGVWPPKLYMLTIGKLKKPISEWGPQNFPTSVVELYLYGDDGVGSCSQFSHLLHSSITHLGIHAFEKLESSSMGLEHLSSLQHLFISDCPNMKDLPEVLLPSLLSLTVSYNCPKLVKRCSKRGNYRPHISHIPRISIDSSDSWS